jgi:hypothetical protein
VLPRPASTFTAKVEGRRQAGALLEALERAVGPRRGSAAAGKIPTGARWSSARTVYW